MLSSSARLRSRTDFARCYNKGRFSRGQYVNIKALPNSKGHPRVGIVVSKKVAKRAVARNLLRRRIAAIVKDQLSSLAPVDIVIMVQPPAVGAAFSALKPDVERAILKFTKETK